MFWKVLVSFIFIVHEYLPYVNVNSYYAVVQMVHDATYTSITNISPSIIDTIKQVNPK